MTKENWLKNSRLCPSLHSLNSPCVYLKQMFQAGCTLQPEVRTEVYRTWIHFSAAPTSCLHIAAGLRTTQGKKIGRGGVCDRKEQMTVVVILTPLLGVHVKSAVDLWLSLRLPLPAIFSLLLWQALIGMLSSVIREGKGRDGAIHWKKKNRQLTCRETIFSLLFSNATQTQEKNTAGMHWTNFSVSLKSWTDF